MSKKEFYSFWLMCIFFSCTTNENSKINGSDTSKIFQQILNSKIFVKDNIARTDSLFFLRTKYYNRSWPTQTKYFKLILINSNSQSKMVNFGENWPYDGRRRIEVLKFNVKLDTARVLMLEYGGQVFYDFILKQSGNEWKIFKEELDIGGSREYYGFEKDKWYLDLKKKIKPVKPMFAPPETKD